MRYGIYDKLGPRIRHTSVVRPKRNPEVDRREIQSESVLSFPSNALRDPGRSRLMPAISTDIGERYLSAGQFS